MIAPLPKVPVVASSLFEARYFTATIEVLRTSSETDTDGDTVSGKELPVATLPGRIVRGKDPLETAQAERVVSIKNWEIRLDLAAIEKRRREKGCFKIEKTDRLRDKKSGRVCEVIDDDAIRTEEGYLSVFCVQVG